MRDYCIMKLEEFYQPTNEVKKITAKDDPCWKGYHIVGTKQKNGREVPNCVPGKKETNEGFNPQDVVKLDIPLLIRLLEYAREDAKTDMDLHCVAEKLIDLSENGQTLSMNDYNNIVVKNKKGNY